MCVCACVCVLCKFVCVWAVLSLCMIHGSEYLFLWQPSTIYRGLSHPTHRCAHTHPLNRLRCLGYPSATQTKWYARAHTHTCTTPALSWTNTSTSRSMQAPFFCHRRWHVSQYYGTISLTLWASICCVLSGPHRAPCFSHWQRKR